jgi:hypothetical protein
LEEFNSGLNLKPCKVQLIQAFTEKDKVMRVAKSKDLHPINRRGHVA